MVKNLPLRVVSTSLLIAVLAVLLMTITASAHTAIVHRSLSLSSVSTATVPNSNIELNSRKKPHYIPGTITCKVSSTLSFDITNKTKKPRTVTYGGSPLVTIPAGGVQGFNVVKAGTYKLGLMGSGSLLTVVAS